MLTDAPVAEAEEEEEEFFDSGATEQKTETEEVIESEVCGQTVTLYLFEMVFFIVDVRQPPTHEAGIRID